MQRMLDNEKLEIPCPECQQVVRTTIGRARRSPTVRCPGGHTIKVDARQLDRELGKVDRALDNLIRAGR
jgi:hypothetical protein